MPKDVSQICSPEAVALLYPMGYTLRMIEIRTTDWFDKWLRKLRDSQARARILVRIRRLSFGNPGDVKPVGEGVSEMRINHGPGYRVYYVQRGTELVILLVGGDKASQERDIAKAIELARGLED
jgi:putative addiction module killer protein